MTPSPWLTECRLQIEAAAALGPVVDLACGRGRNALALARWGTPVIGVDRNADFLGELAATARAEALPLECVRADLEADAGFPIRSGSCGVILVFRFLYRPLAPRIAEALRPGGLLIAETFTSNQQQFGYGPTRAEFLLSEGELPTLYPELVAESTWEGVSEVGPRPEAVARLLARRPAGAETN